MNILDPAKLRDTIMRERSAGIVTVDYRSVKPFYVGTKRVKVDSYIANFGFLPLGHEWRYINKKEATRILRFILESGLAYGTTLMTPARADLLADSFLRLFSRTESRYCSNGLLTRSGGSSNPITNSTFDHGIVAYDDQNIGIAWVQDED
jgi:hypothetical protein